MSLPEGLATAAFRGRVTLDDLACDRLTDPRVRALARRVAVSPDDELEGAFPAPTPLHPGRRRRGARVIAT